MGARFKTWFLSLSKREQGMVALGAVAVLSLLIYYVIFSPLNKALNAERLQLARNQVAWQWIHRAKGQLLHSNNHARVPVRNIMLTAEHSLAEHGLAIYLRAVSAPQPNQVQIKLAQVPFDKLIDWLQFLLHRDRIKVSQFQADKAARLGTVDAQFTLQTQ